MNASFLKECVICDLILPLLQHYWVSIFIKEKNCLKEYYVAMETGISYKSHYYIEKISKDCSKQTMWLLFIKTLLKASPALQASPARGAGSPVWAFGPGSSSGSGSQALIKSLINWFFKFGRVWIGWTLQRRVAAQNKQQPHEISVLTRYCIYMNVCIVQSKITGGYWRNLTADWESNLDTEIVLLFSTQLVEHCRLWLAAYWILWAGRSEGMSSLFSSTICWFIIF